MDNFNSQPRRCCYRWLGWFFLINSLIASLILFAYLPQLATLSAVPDASTTSIIFSWTYAAFAFVAQATFFMCLAAILCAVLASLLPWRWLIITVGAVLSAILQFLFISDAMIYHLYHMHYALVGWQVYKVGAMNQVFTLGLSEKLMVMLALSVVIVLEAILAMWLWRVFSNPRFRRTGRILWVAVLGCWFLVYASFGLAVGAHFWGSAYRYSILRVGRTAPYLSEIYLALFDRQDIKHLTLNQEQIPVVTQALNKRLNYPKHTLVYQAQRHPLNILMIVIDTWRYTSMNALVTPNIYHFAQQAIQFQKHYSGGNCTQPGIFSLFYGIPPTYWDAVLRESKEALLIEALKKQGYEFGIFLSAPINFPSWDKTLFVNVSGIKHIDGDSSLARDQQITQDALKFLQHRDKAKPFFGFVFYDVLHNYCEPARPGHNPFQPAVKSCDRFSLNASSSALPYLNLYNNKARFVDRQVAEILNALDRLKLYKNTIVVITSDHGEQINDGGQGLFGHASAYTSYQLQVPMIISWPGRQPRRVQGETTHYDFVPTIMRDVLGYKNQFQDYSVGRSLFSTKRENYFTAGSYGDYAIVLGGQVLRIYPNGDFSTLNLQGKMIPRLSYKKAILNKVIDDLESYYK